MTRLKPGIRSALRYFAFLVGNGTLEMNGVLRGIDYRAALVEFGSELEMVFAIFTNVLEVDDQAVATNEAAAARRAAQWIRQYNDPTYIVEPPFQPWETELV